MSAPSVSVSALFQSAYGKRIPGVEAVAIGERMRHVTFAVFLMAVVDSKGHTYFETALQIPSQIQLDGRVGNEDLGSIAG